MKATALTPPSQRGRALRATYQQAVHVLDKGSHLPACYTQLPWQEL